MIKTNTKISKTAMVAVGVGAAAAAAAGAYWFYGSPNAAKHRKATRSWMLKARAEVLEAVEAVIAKAGEMDKETYMNIVEGVLKRYSKLADVTSADLVQMTRDMKATWQHMQKAHKSSAVKKVKKTTKKIVKKAD